MKQQPSKAINAWLWIAQSFLAAIFLLTGGMKLAMPMEKIAEMLPWVANAPAVLVRFIGLSEVLGAAGLILPAALRIKPQLTTLAAAGVAIVMVLATAFHLLQGELAHAVAPIVMFIIALFIAWGRTKKAPIESKDRMTKVIVITAQSRSLRYR
jgi:putative oxidoreductase